MKALNIKVEEDLYEKLRASSFVQKKPMAVIIREYIQLGLEKEKEFLKEQSSKNSEIDDEVFNLAMKESFKRFDDVYKKLAQ
jgi:predicted DNA-binding protein